MGLTAQVFAVGTFSGSVVPYLNYPPAFYANTREGVVLPEIVFWIETGSNASRELASCFEVDPWDFNRHELDPSVVDLPRLTQLVGEDDVARFLGLRSAGFRFFFLPNG
jgi:hypothetical protein